AGVVLGEKAGGVPLLTVAADVGVAAGIQGHASGGDVAGTAGQLLGPEDVAAGVQLGEEALAAACGRRGRLCVPGQVGVAAAVHGHRLAVAAARLVGEPLCPEEVAVGIHLADVARGVGAGAGQGRAAEALRAVEVAGEGDVAATVQGDAGVEAAAQPAELLGP